MEQRQRQCKTRDPARERPARANDKPGVGRLCDRKLRTGAEGGHPGEQRKVRVEVHEPEHPAAKHRGVGEVEVDPPQAQRDHEAAARDEPRFEAEAEPGHPGHDRHDRLAEHDDEERAEAVGDVRHDDRSGTEHLPGARRRREVDGDRQAPEDVPVGPRHEDRDEPETRRQDEGGGVQIDQRAPLAPDVAPGSDIHRDQHRAHHDVGGGEPHGPSVARDHPWDLDRECRDRERGRRLRHPVDHIVCVEAVGVHREARPRPGHHHEEAGKPSEHDTRRVLRQAGRELGDRRDEHEVEIELEPGGVALLTRVLGGAQPGWLEAKRRSAAAHVREP